MTHVLPTGLTIIDTTNINGRYLLHKARTDYGDVHWLVYDLLSQTNGRPECIRHSDVKDEVLRGLAKNESIEAIFA